MRPSIKLTCHWKWQLYINASNTNTAITTQLEESKRKIAMEKNIRKATWKSKIFKNKSKDRDSNFLVIFSSCKA